MSKSKEMIFKDFMGRERNIEDYVCSELDGADYGRGQLEEITATSRNTLDAFSRLIKTLAESERLNQEQIKYIVDGY